MPIKTKPKLKMDKARAEFLAAWEAAVEPLLKRSGLSPGEREELMAVLWKHWNARKR